MYSYPAVQEKTWISAVNLTAGKQNWDKNPYQSWDPEPNHFQAWDRNFLIRVSLVIFSTTFFLQCFNDYWKRYVLMVMNIKLTIAKHSTVSTGIFNVFRTYPNPSFFFNGQNLEIWWNCAGWTEHGDGWRQPDWSLQVKFWYNILFFFNYSSLLRFCLLSRFDRVFF